ncbi:hypothetical protein L6164_020389 [Bauhinia variegata]|uniref:Uncharacterized protein n=1 Tax=Bauhinia variegata TaxID=167791 RepID=A0ACB9MV83_BAUVA|nr:hypothetical protein L6164_020389 [Bauhinia variegata]
MAEDIHKETGKVAEDIEKVTGKVAGDIVKESGEMAGDVEKAIGEIAGDVEKASGEIAADVLKESGEIAEDNLKESGEVAGNTEKESGEIAEDNVKESGGVAGNTEKESGEKAEDIKKESAEMDGDIVDGKDLATLILSRLPVKSLVRFQCVKKSWSLFIKNPEFISAHLETFNRINMENNRFCLLFKRNREVRDDPMLLMVKDSVSRLCFYQAARRSHQNRRHLTREPKASDFHLFGPVNGGYYFHSDLRFLINPSMREFRLIPDAPFSSGSYFVGCYDNFGFDPKTKDWKIVTIQCWRAKPPEDDINATNDFYRAYVYALSSGSWRNVDCSLLSGVVMWGNSLSGNFVHGSCHWWAYDDDDYLVVAFDMLEDVFRLLRFENGDAGAYVGNFKESIAVIFSPEDATETQFDIWVTPEYGEDKPWDKLLTIRPIEEVKWPLAFWKDRCVLESEDRGLVLYDHETLEEENLGFEGEDNMIVAAVYMESLFSLRKDSETGVFFVDIVPQH